MLHKSLILHILGFVIYQMTAKDGNLYQTNSMTLVYILESFFCFLNLMKVYSYLNDSAIQYIWHFHNKLRKTYAKINCFQSKPSTFILYLFRVWYSVICECNDWRLNNMRYIYIILIKFYINYTEHIFSIMYRRKSNKTCDKNGTS